jgi:ribonuclease HI
MSKLHDVWTDGSYNHTHHVGGAGWLIRHDGEDTEGWRSLKDFPKDAKPHGSDAAEIFAVSNALRAIPDGSVVRLRLDAQNVIDWLQAGRITSKSKSDVRFLRSIFGSAMEGINAMDKVEFIKVGGRQNVDLQRAHDLSRRASHNARLGK